jgi:NAD(P)-dependent dehydrogenase (short-subunit alcohol dehydrogenase family)
MGSGLLEGKVALITGAGSGIGRASACTMAHEGARVMVADVDVDGLAQTVALITAAGGEVASQQCDVTSADSVTAMVQATIDRFGALHCAHNNAGVEGEVGRTADTTEENFDFTYNVNLKGVFLCMRAEIVHMLDNGGGTIVNTASIAGIEGARQLPAYVASKHACLGLTRTAALEYASKNIRVNAVCPGPIRTPMIESIIASNPQMEAPMVKAIPMRRIGEPEEIAEAATWLCSDRSSFVNGHGLVLDGGMTAGS